ncbi:CHAT domain-containing tetratricopeptide repeat protein [Hyalangium versicolor]|uniref:CHAT domain-containing tetratricopeptide repeat protein n=1 Tax=Hyalangium versicolor TaxID=2861190 RepID=UPI0028150202|nr:CHAT domain-containing tetratricopeptide repeat protein [Hyalangium versicolor]
MAILVLYCAACTSASTAPTDARLLEAQKAFDEARKLEEAGNYPEAVLLAERAVNLREAVLGTEHPDVAQCVSLLGILHMEQGHYALAEQLHLRALTIRETALGKEDTDTAASLNSLGILYKNQGQFERAEPLLQRALAIWETTSGSNSIRVAAALHNLANLYMEEGRYDRTESLLQRATSIHEATLGEDDPRVASSLNNLANLHFLRGHYEQAESLFQRALRIREKVLEANHPDIASTLANLGTIYTAQGDYPHAEQFLQRAIAMREQALGSDHPDVADALSNLAALHEIQGDYTRAEPLYERALEIAEKTFGKNHPDVADQLLNLADLLALEGHREQAEPLYERSLAMKESLFGKSHREVALTLHNFAALYLEQGQYVLAEPLLERSLATYEATLGKNHPDLTNTLSDLARLRLAQHRLDEAVSIFERAFTISEEHLRQEVLGFSENRLAHFLALLRTDEERLYALVRAYPDNEQVRRLALCAALLRKGRSIEELSDTSRIVYRGLGPADRELFDRLRAVRTQQASLALGNSEPPADYPQRLKELTEQGDALEADLARHSKPLRALFALPQPSELIEGVAAALPADGVLVEFVAYQDIPLVPTPGTLPSPVPSKLRYLALLLFADGHTQALDLGHAGPIDRAALRLHHALARQSPTYQPAAQALYKQAFQPLLPLLGKAQRLFLSPEGQLSLVPFAALHDGRRFLVDAFDITYLTSGKDLLPHSKESAPASSVVVLANPDFSAAPSPGALGMQEAPEQAERSASIERFFSTFRSELVEAPWRPLPGTRQEAEAIQRMLPQAQVLMGRAASKEALLKLSAPGVLHIATHGFFLEDTKAVAATRSPASFGAVGEGGPVKRSPDPLLRSGLVLAGARIPETPSGDFRREDSLVTALELSGLDLWGTQLVVLSACQTGLGDVKLGQGVYGLRRAVMVAGAQTLVTSLWKVRDEETRHLMETYYRNLLAGQGRAAALRAAMRTLRQRHPHPYFWASFIAMGQDTPLQGVTPQSASRSPP